MIKISLKFYQSFPDKSPFPATLSLEDQGRFIVGYYHQMQDFFSKKKESDEDQNYIATKEEIKI